MNLVAEDLQVLKPDIGSEVDARSALAHLGFDVDLSLLARNRDAVMPIHHKIDLPDFIQNDGRQADLLIKGTVDTLPARRQFVAGGQKDAVKFVIAIQTARDLLYEHGLHAAIDRTANMQFFLDFII